MKLIYRSAFWVASLLLVLLCWMVFRADKREIDTLVEQLTESQNRLHYIEHLNVRHEANIKRITSQLKLLQADKHLINSVYSNGSGSSSSSGGIGGGNLSIPVNFSILNDFPLSYDLSLPNFFTHLPHLQTMPHAIQPAIKLSKSRYGVTFVMGVPTIKREKYSYLVETIDSLLRGLVDSDKEDCLIVVSICEINDQIYINETISSLEARFQAELESGLLEVIVPSPYYYPSFEHLTNAFGDTEERVRWRTKQNLDYSYLMMYAKSRGQYYVQLEDDVVTKSGYVGVMRQFAAGFDEKEWLLLEFSHLGFIGKLMKTKDLGTLTEFFLMFHRDKPVDWLLDNLLYVKVCNPEKNVKECNKAMLSLRKTFKPSLFQHVGTFSSLKGKVQKLKDKYFKASKGGTLHLNPLADVSTTIHAYGANSLLQAYTGQGIFWGLSPSKGDHILFRFKKPCHLASFRFESSDVEHYSDKFYNASVQILPQHAIASTPTTTTTTTTTINNKKHNNNNINNKNNKSAEVSTNQSYKVMQDGFVHLTWFDSLTGRAEGEVPAHLQPITSLRILMHSSLENWVILREIILNEKNSL